MGTPSFCFFGSKSSSVMPKLFSKASSWSSLFCDCASARPGKETNAPTSKQRAASQGRSPPLKGIIVIARYDSITLGGFVELGRRLEVGLRHLLDRLADLGDV